jgi:uncharacterized membrane protein YphA (DoxX/SURF4 family)
MLRTIIKWFRDVPIHGGPSLLILRLMAGGVFFWEGLLKFVYVNQGAGRFTKLGFPGVVGEAIGAFELLGGAGLLLGLGTRWLAVPFIGEMVVAMLTTKVALFLGTSPLPLPPSPPQVGAWAVLHEIRSEYAQLAVCAFLALEGPGVWSLDAWRRRRRAHLGRRGDLR